MSSLPGRSGTENQVLRKDKRRTFWARRGGTDVSGLLIHKEAAEQETWEWFAKRWGQEKGPKKDRHVNCKSPLKEGNHQCERNVLENYLRLTWQKTAEKTGL